MENQILDTAKQYSKNWWVSILVGLLSIGMGAWCIATPDSTLVALTMFFVITFFVVGTMDIIYAVSNKHTKGWGWTLTAGIVDILFGILLISMPPLMVTAMLIYYVGFWIMFRSIWAIGVSSDMQRFGGGRNLLIIGILGLVFSFLYLISPVFSNGGVLVMLVSIAFMTYGVFRIVLGFNLRSINKELKELEDVN